MSKHMTKQIILKNKFHTLLKQKFADIKNQNFKIRSKMARGSCTTLLRSNWCSGTH